MVKLKDLKVGQKVYKISKYYDIEELIVTKEKYKTKYKSINKETVYRVEVESNDYIIELFKKDQENLFFNKQEAENFMCEYEMEREQRWRDYFLLASDLFEKCKNIGCLTETDKRIIKKVLSEKYQ